ncbi:MAG: TAT-variant-translocated molybdopterin oxidoreductase, partial [Candidatus Zixiibacteriota bacterium]
MKKKTDPDEKKYWRSLGERERTAEYRKHLRNEYRENETDDIQWSRRNFLAIMGASMALAGLAGCRRPIEKIIPYVAQPEEIIPGVPEYYATSMPFGTSVYGLIVETHEGRPTKIEGNPGHPSTLGSTDFMTQASILNLYDPDRSRAVRHKGVEKNYDDFVTFWRERHKEFAKINGAGLAVLSESFSSPTLFRLRQDLLKQFPEVRWATYEPLSDENIFRALKNLTGKILRPVYYFDQADIILSIDSDFLQFESESISTARGFANGRRDVDRNRNMNRLYVIESSFTITGGMADHRLRMSSSRIGHFLIALAAELAKNGVGVGDLPPVNTGEFDEEWLSALARDLLHHKGNGLVVAGRRQPVWVHELAMIINQALGNIGHTVFFREIRDTLLPDISELQELVTDLDKGSIDTLVIMGGNPVYNAPVDFEFQSALEKVTHSVHFSEYFDETSQRSEWHIPRAHFLESWGDVRAADGTSGVIQPMIEPLFGGHADVELLSLLSTGRIMRGHDIVR